MDRVYLVITTADMAEAFKVLTDYRETEQGGGYTTHIETMAFIEANFEGVDRAEKVRNYIRNSYENHGTRFVVLGGDADGEMENHKVPMRGLYQRYEADGEVIAEDTSVPSDRYYAYLDGSFNSDGDEYWGEVDDGADINPKYQSLDWSYEVAVGRIAADNSEEATNHINKIIAFEHQNLPGTALLAGEKLYDNQVWGGEYLDWLDICNDSTKVYDRDRTSYWTSMDLITEINTDQYSQLHHSGHGSIETGARINISDINKFTNANPLFIYSQGSYAAAIDITDSFAEVITNKYSRGGAAAVIASSSQAWFNIDHHESTPRMHNFFQEFQYNYGYPLGVSLLIADLEARGGGYSYTDRWTSVSTNLIGDPAIKIYQPVVNSAPVISSFSGEIWYENNIPKGINIRAEATVEHYDLHTITLFYDDKALLTENIGRRNSGSVYFPLQFAEATPGEHCVSARASDVFGDFSPMSEKVCFTISDNSAPAVEGVEIDMRPDMKKIIARVIDNDLDVEQVTCTFDDEYTTDALLVLDDVDVTLWECQIPDLLLWQDHQVSIQARDETGLLSNTSGPHSFRFQTAPEIENVEINMHPDIQEIVARVLDLSYDMEQVTCTFDDTYTTDAILKLDDADITIWQCQMPDLLLDREHQVTVQAKDKAGLLSEISGPHAFRFYHLPEFTIEVDTSTPELAVISGTAFDQDGDLDKVVMQFGSNNYWVTAEGLENYSYHAYLRPGNHRVTVKAIDKMGYLWTQYKNFTVTAAENCNQYTATNAEHELAGRAYTKTEVTGGYCWGSFCWGQKETTTWHALGSDDNMGSSSDTKTTLSEKPAGHFSIGSCPANSYAPVVTIEEKSISKDGVVTIAASATDPNGDLVPGVVYESDISPSFCELVGPVHYCSYGPLAEGEYTIYVSAYDKLGNTSEREVIEIKIGGNETCISSTNLQHINEGRAYAGGTLDLYAYAIGSDNSLGLKGSQYYSTATSLKESSDGFWEKVDSCE